MSWVLAEIGNSLVAIEKENCYNYFDSEFLKWIGIIFIVLPICSSGILILNS